MPKELNHKIMMKSKVTFVLVLLFTYIILFEFILPFNKVLPKPSLLYESFLYIWKDYDLLSALAITSTVIYLAIILAYLVVYVSAGIIIKFALEYPDAIEKLKVFRYFPAFFIAILFSYWFGESLVAEFVFAFLTSFALILFHLISEIKNHNPVYADTASNLGLNKYSICSKVIFKDIQPNHFNGLIRIHYYLWILVMIYEFINNIGGFGGVYKTALIYRDFVGLFSVALVISILILFGSIVINYIKEKLFFWE